MKRFLNLFLVFILIITLTACTNNLKQKTPVEVLDEVFNNVTEVNPVEITIGLDSAFTQDGMKTEMPLSLSIAQNFVNTKNYKAVIKLSDNPFIGKQTLYIDLNDTDSKIYMPGKLISSIVGIEDDSNKWIAETIEIDEETFDASEIVTDHEKIDLKSLLKEDEFVLIEEGELVNKYQLKITKDLLNRIQDTLEVEDKEDFEDFSYTVLLDISIDMKNKRITEMELDLKDIVSKVLNDNLSDTSSISVDAIEKLKLSLGIKYDNVEVKIPADVVNNAMSAEEYENYLTGKIQG